MISLSICTFNKQGLGDLKKIESVLCWIKNKNYNIVLLQETHCVTDKEDVWQKNLDGNIIYTHHKNQKTSVGISFSKKNVEIVIKYIESKGHRIVLDMLVDEVRYMLVNIYTPYTDDVTFFKTSI